MFFDEDFITAVNDNPVASIIKASEIILQTISALDNGKSWTDKEHDILWEGATFIQLILDTYGLEFHKDCPEATESIDHNCPSLKDWITGVKAHFNTKSNENVIKQRINTITNQYQSVLKKAFSYEFTKGDFNRIRSLINKLHESIVENRKIDKKYKHRLLEKLEGIQSKFHKTFSNLDGFWGLIGDAGVVLGKLGPEAKPIIESIREITEIIWKTQARTEELPSSAKNPIFEDDDQLLESDVQSPEAANNPKDGSTGWTFALQASTNC